MKFLRRCWRLARDLFYRFTGPCPLWHATTDRIQRINDNRIIFECADCLRATSEVPKGHRVGRPIVPMRAQYESWRSRKRA